MTLASLAAGIAGVALLALILADAFETVLVPRRIGRRFRLARVFYRGTWHLWRTLAGRIRRVPPREAMLSFYGPLSLLLLLVLWAAGMIVGFALLQLAVLGAAGRPIEHFPTLLYMSGETFFTLGFGDITPFTRFGRFLAVIESGLGFGFLGTVVGYLPTMYDAFSQREIEISLLDARAGSPPTAAEFLSRGGTSGAAGGNEVVLRDWERWSAQLLETHISYPQLAYYRSQHLNQSWLAALTAILDSCALLLAGRSEPPAGQVQATFAMARHALVDITQSFVTRHRPGAPDRLPASELARLRARLADPPVCVSGSREFEQRLAALRILYEPYAQALAQHLLFDLPPWIHAEARRDNWRGGPWDRKLAEQAAPEHRAEEHF